MGTALNVSAWSTTAASNDGADSTIGTVSNNSAPNTVDDWVRGIMASVKRYILDTDGGITAGGTADALIITTNRAISSGHQAAGFSVRFKASNTNTGATTVNVDSLGAKSIKRLNGDDLAAGDIVSGGIYDIAFDGTNYVLLTGGAGSGLYGTLSGDNTWSGANTFTGALNIGNSDTTLSRVSAGNVAIDGNLIYRAGGTDVAVADGGTGASTVAGAYANLAPSALASFSAHKNGTIQTISSTSETTVTFGTEVFDVGAKFASNAWTPPAGKVLIQARLTVSGTGSDVITVRLKRAGASIAEIITSNATSETINLVQIATADGSQAFTVTIKSTNDTSYIIDGTAVRTYFQGTMI